MRILVFAENVAAADGGQIINRWIIGENIVAQPDLINVDPVFMSFDPFRENVDAAIVAGSQGPTVLLAEENFHVPLPHRTALTVQFIHGVKWQLVPKQRLVVVIGNERPVGIGTESKNRFIFVAFIVVPQLPGIRFLGKSRRRLTSHVHAATTLVIDRPGDMSAVARRCIRSQRHTVTVRKRTRSWISTCRVDGFSEAIEDDNGQI